MANTYSKLNIWGLTGYDAVFFLDSDTAVLRNIDHVIDGAEQIRALQDHQHYRQSCIC